MQTIVTNEFGVFSDVVSALQNSKMGFALVQTDDSHMMSFSWYTKDGQYAPCEVYPVQYRQHMLDDVTLTKVRANGVWALFVRWCGCGHNRCLAKTPYGSKVFLKFLDDHAYLKTDYLILTTV